MYGSSHTVQCSKPVDGLFEIMEFVMKFQSCQVEGSADVSKFKKNKKCSSSATLWSKGGADGVVCVLVAGDWVVALCSVFLKKS